NFDWQQSAQYAPGKLQASTFSERTLEVRDQLLSLLTGDALDSEAGQQAQTLYRLYADMDARNAQGVAPILPWVEAIEAIETLDDLTAFMQRRDVPYRAPYTAEVVTDFMDSTRRMIGVYNGAWLIDDADERKAPSEVGARAAEGLRLVLRGMLGRIGYAEEEAAERTERALAFEDRLAAHSFGASDRKQPDFYASLYNRVTMDELRAISPAFPIDKLLADYAEAGATTFVLYNAEELADVSALYTEENLEEWKNYLLARTLVLCASALDQACMDLLDQETSLIAGVEYHSDAASIAYDMCAAYLGMEMGQIYAEHFVPASVKADVARLVDELLAVFRGRLEKAGWMGEETRAHALEKLDSITVRVVCPDDWSSYLHGGLALRGFDEGGSLMEAIIAIGRSDHARALQTVLDPVDRTRWPMSPMETNACYISSDNSISLLAGILGGGFYQADASREQLLGSLGLIVAHEITHGFDTTGSQFDKDGNMANWWTDADRAAFTARTDKVRDYYASIEALPGQYLDGQLTLGETVADLGSMSCVLELAAQEPDFDYQAFFKSFATVWRMKEPLGAAEYLLSLEVHAPGYLRTNVTSQQFEEFYTAFGVQEGDGMYLAPEARLSVW
ncbi:MAG: M13 family metallopeptidase, partial [Eubacteriales bacterium]|nr:M13 family metallopeptidase [Eubacteriales bacterium]